MTRLTNNYSYLGRKYGIALKPEVINNIQSDLEEKVASFISRRSNIIAPIRAKLFALSFDNQTDTPAVKPSDEEFGKIIDARAAYEKHRQAKSNREAFTKAMKSYKAYADSLKAYVRKAERRSNLQYHQFILGASMHTGSHFSSEPICFKSLLYSEYAEELQKEVDGFEH